MLNDTEFLIHITNGINTPLNQTPSFEFLPSPSQQKLLNKLNNLIYQNNNEQSDEDDDNPGIQCNYYSTHEFCQSKFNSSKSFSILHLNIHSIQLHIEDLRIMLQLLNFKFDIIAISESKLQENIEPQIDISLSGFQSPLSTPTAASKGGVLIYVANEINFKPRNDLKIYKTKELESVFIEIINPKKSNCILGVIYRHPCMDATAFNENYLQLTLEKLSHENHKKNIYNRRF